MSMDMNKMLQQVQQMQEDMLKAQEELANERVEASVGGGMVTVTASGAGEIVGVKISPEAIDPDDPETLEDLVLAGVNQALKNAQDLAQSKLGDVSGGLKGLGLRALRPGRQPAHRGWRLRRGAGSRARTCPYLLGTARAIAAPGWSHPSPSSTPTTDQASRHNSRLCSARPSRT